MQDAGETDQAACTGNDFALVEIDPADVPALDPTVPVWGGPVGIHSGQVPLGDAVYAYGNSESKMDQAALSPMRGRSADPADFGWFHYAYFAPLSIAGDSGAAVLTADGQALGDLTQGLLLPFPGADLVGDLGHQLAYLNAHAGFRFPVTLVEGLRPFSG